MAKTLPKSEIGKVGYFSSDGALLFVMAAKISNGKFLLYKNDDTGLVKLGEASDPKKLEAEFKVYEMMNGGIEKCCTKKKRQKKTDENV